MNTVKSETIAFRVSSETFNRIKNRAELADKSVHEWTRDFVEQGLGETHGLSSGEKILLKEFLNLRELCESVFELSLKNELTELNYENVLINNAEKREQTVADYFLRNDDFSSEK